MNNQKVFRISARNLFLTYVKVPQEWNLRFVKQKLIDEILIHRKGERKYKTRVKAYVIAEEDHKEAIGEGDYERGSKHYHCLVELDGLINILNEDMLDINGIHGNYQAVKNVFSVLNYVKKCGNWIGEGYPGMQNRERAVLEASTDIDARMMLMNRMGPREKIKLREDMVTIRKKKTIIEEIVAKAPVYAFQEILRPFIREAGFSREGRPVGLLMYGEPKSGKTTLAYRIARDLNEDVMVVYDPKEMAEHYMGEHVILFDEMTKEKFEENRNMISNLITEPQAKTKSYYGSKKIEWPRKIMISTNEDISTWRFNEAIEERLLIVRTKENGEYQYQKYEKGELMNLSINQLKDKFTRLV